MDWWSRDVSRIDILSFVHLIYFLIMAVSLALLIFNREKVKRNREQIANLILMISILQQILLYVWHIAEHNFDLSTSLPFQISRVNSLLGIWFLLTKNNKVLDVLFFFGLFAYGSFAYPTTIYPLSHSMGLSFVINHVITLILPYFGYIAYHWRPKLSSVFKAYGWFIIYFIFVYILNPIVDGNYFFLKRRPFFIDMSDHLYILTVFSIVFIGFYLAFIVVTLINKYISKENSSRS